VYDENGIGGDGEYYGGDGEYYGSNDAQLDGIYVFYDGASGGKKISCALPFDLEPGVINALRTSLLGASSTRVTLLTKTRARVITGPSTTSPRA
jgi:hypothetical protein